MYIEDSKAVVRRIQARDFYSVLGAVNDEAWTLFLLGVDGKCDVMRGAGRNKPHLYAADAIYGFDHSIS